MFLRERTAGFDWVIRAAERPVRRRLLTETPVHPNVSFPDFCA
jgi:hypothetical protein